MQSKWDSVPFRVFHPAIRKFMLLGKSSGFFPEFPDLLSRYLEMIKNELAHENTELTIIRYFISPWCVAQIVLKLKTFQQDKPFQP